MAITRNAANPKMHKLIPIVFAGILWPMSPAMADEGPEADIGAIRSARATSNQAIADHDAEAIASFWDKEYVIAISSGDLEYGPEVAKESFAQHFAEIPDVVYVRTPNEIIVSKNYPLAWEQGNWVGTMTNEKGYLKKGGTYASGWRKVDGVWKIRSELFVAIYCEGAGC